MLDTVAHQTYTFISRDQRKGKRASMQFMHSEFHLHMSRRWQHVPTNMLRNFLPVQTGYMDNLTQGRHVRMPIHCSTILGCITSRLIKVLSKLINIGKGLEIQQTELRVWAVRRAIYLRGAMSIIFVWKSKYEKWMNHNKIREYARLNLRRYFA